MGPPVSVQSCFRVLLCRKSNFLARSLVLCSQFLFDLCFLQLVSSTASAAINAAQEVAIAVLVEYEYGALRRIEPTRLHRDNICAHLCVAIADPQCCAGCSISVH